MKRTSAFPVATFLLVAIVPCAVAQEVERSQLPIPDAPFEGEIGKTFEDSKQDYPQPVTPPNGAPNVVLILIDDLGFGHPSTFGGPIPTPALDQLAREGVRYNRLSVTAIPPSGGGVIEGRLFSLDAVFDEVVPFAV